jgi:hypothetical protein
MKKASLLQIREGKTVSDNNVKEKLIEIFDEVFLHDGFGNFRVEMKILKRNQKEVIIHCGKQYRFTVDYQTNP